MKIKKSVLFIIAFLVVSLAIYTVAASVSVGKQSHQITTSYPFGAELKGWFNMSLNNEPLNSLLESSTGGKISLLNFFSLPSNSDSIFSCNPSSCDSAFQLSNPGTEKVLDLDEGEFAFLGFRIQNANPITDVSAFNFELISNNPETSKFPLAIDLRSDGLNEWEAYQSSGNYQSENDGCFRNIGTKTTDILSVSDKYCEKIELTRSPSVELGAYISKSTTQSSKFAMTIERADDSDSPEECLITTSGTGLRRVSCVPEYQVSEDRDYFVCINLKNGEGKIDYETDVPCGFSGDFEGDFTHDFNIFARTSNYSSDISIVFNDEEMETYGGEITNLAGYVEEYLSTYENAQGEIDCEEGCIIPLMIYSGVEQDITISNVELTYVAGVKISSDKIYSATETSATVDAPYQIFYLDGAGFKVPADYGSKVISISLGGSKIFSQNITVEKTVGIGNLTPTTTGVRYQTKFSIKGSDPNITQYQWNWGDGKVDLTMNGTAVHTYNASGVYTLSVTVKDSKGKNSTKGFDITVAPASEIVPFLLENTETNVEKIKSQLPAFSDFEQESVENLFQLETISEEIELLKDASLNAITEEDYEIILTELFELNIPASISKSSFAGGFIFYLSGNNIDLDILKEIAGGDYGNKEEGYKESILAWNVANTNVVMNFSEISATYESGTQPILRTFAFDITNNGEGAYLIVRDMENLMFWGGFTGEEADGYKYIELKEGKSSILFSTTEEVDFATLPMFISPSLENLVIAEWSPFEPEGGLKKWIIFVIIVIAILASVAAVWIVLQLWYKRKYENYLFKNRNNLYNLVNFVDNEKKKGINERDIISKLRKAGWNSEQIRYATRKHGGKETGLPSIPIEKIIKKKE